MRVRIAPPRPPGTPAGRADEDRPDRGVAGEGRDPVTSVEGVPASREKQPAVRRVRLYRLG